MAKFSGATTVTRTSGPMRTTTPTRTFEGGQGYKLDLQSELFTLVVSDFAGEPTYYESADARVKRLLSLATAATEQDPTFVANLARWARVSAHMRSTPVVLACAYAKAGGPGARAVIDSVCQRADEPAEVLGFWLTTYGRRIPQPVKRGVADAAVRLYTERSALRYDGDSRGVRMADVIDLTHPKPKAVWQSRLFAYLLDRRHNRDDINVGGLPTIDYARHLDRLPEGERRAKIREIGPEGLAEAGYSWERLGGWLPGGMDAEAWEAIIPSMGYMALLRNLRNFEQAKVRPDVLRQVAERIADPDQVARSRQLPFRFWSAYRNSGTMVFGPALERALDASLANIPNLTGRTLVLVDVSGSMTGTVSAKSKVQRWEVGAVMASALATKGQVDLVAYATRSAMVPVQLSTLRTAEGLQRANNASQLDHSTQTWPAVNRWFAGHDRVVVFTDLQDHPNRAPVPAGVPVYVWDLAGYGRTNIEVGGNRHLLAGFSDKSFDLMAILESRKDARWPWEQATG